MIETIELPEMTAIGIFVEGKFADLSTLVPAAWKRLFETDTGAQNFLGVSLDRSDDTYREFVGYLAAMKTELPEGLVRTTIPAGQYLRLRYDGPVTGIADGFERIFAHAAAHGIKVTHFKLDFGYLPGMPDGKHELHVAIAPKVLQLA